MTGDPTSRRCYVEVQTPIEARDPVSNESRRDWIKFTNFWASIRPKRGREVMALGAQESEVTHVVTSGYYDVLGVQAIMRIVYDHRVFVITAILPDDDYHVDTQIMARETGELA